MANYPYVSPQDESSQYLASILSQYKPGMLGNSATIGNPQGQQDYASQLAQALAEMDSATKQQERAGGLQNAKFIDNSGALGVLAVLAQTYAGKKMDEKASKKYEDASMRAMTAKDILDEAKAERKTARELKATQNEQAQRRKDGEAMGLSGRDLTRYALEGKMGEGVRGVPMMTDQGLVNVDPYTGTAAPISNGPPQQHSQPSMPFDIKGDVPPEVAAAMQADPAAWENGNSIDIKPHGGALMPYKDPAIAQRQASADSRADESLGLARHASDRADKAQQFAQEQAAKKEAATATKPNAMRQDAINFAAAYIGKKPEDVAKMTPEQIREAVAQGGRTMAGPVMGRIPGAGMTFNADLDAYSSAAAAKQARINNPTGTVTNADFIAAEKSVFSSTKPASVNADLVYQALTNGAAPVPQPSAPAAAPQPGHIPTYNPQTGEFE